MAYGAVSWTTGDVITEAKLDQMQANDAAFNSGGGVLGSGLATSAILLGYAAITASVTGFTSEADITGLSSTVTVPSGGRAVKITVHIPDIPTSANSQRAALAIKESTTVLGRRYQWLASTSGGNGVDVIVYVAAPSAASHTYKAMIARDVGAGTIDVYASATEPSFILVELV